MAADRGAAEGDEEPADPVLEAIAGAILDGAPVDWQSRSQAVHPGLLEQLQVLAALATVHTDPAGQSAPDSELRPIEGMRWGPLVLQERIGRGAFGEVFRAWDARLQRDVALKLLLPDPERPDVAGASIREGRLLARVRHPNVVTVFGADSIDGRVGIWTEFVDGSTLAYLIQQRGRFSLDTVAAIGVDVGAALNAVHEAGLLHRDVTAHNVMLEPNGRAVLMDFGAGRERSDWLPGDDRTGTPLYLAPELWEGAPPSQQSDIFSLGVLLFYLASGNHPVTGATTDAVRAALAAGRWTRLRDIRPEVSEAFADVVERCLAPNPKDRFQHVSEVETALLGLRSAQGGAVSTVVTHGSVPRRWGWRTVVACAGLVAGSLLWSGYVPGMFGGGRVISAATASAHARRLVVPPFALIGGPSLDGRYIPLMASGEVSVLDVASGRVRQVTNGKTSPGQAGDAALSADGSLIGYAWQLPDGTAELRVANIDETWPSIAVAPMPALTVMRGEPGTSLVPIEWSRDGQHLLCWAHRADGAADLLLVLRTGAAHTVVRTFRGGRPRRVSLSPDGRHIVYDLAVSAPAPQHDLFIVPTDGGAPRVLLDGPADETLPVWMPDGKRLFFVSDRAGPIEGWVVDVSQGAATRTITRVATDLERVSPLGITDRGTLFYTFEAESEDVRVVATVDGAGPCPTLPRGWGTARRGPAWSPDGATLAYFAARGMSPAAREAVITFLNVSSGRARNVLPGLALFGGGDTPRWSNDGRELLVRGRDYQSRWGYFRVDVRTGAATPAVVGSPMADAIQFGAAFHWTHSDASVGYNRASVGVVAHDLSTHQEQVIVPDPPRGSILSFGFAPDGQTLAYSSNRGDGPVDGVASLEVRPPGEAPRVLVTLPGRRAVLFQGWTGDGRELIYSSRTEASPIPRLWRIPATGGRAADMNIPLDTPHNQNFVALAPDGRCIAHTAGRTAFEIWSLDALLPE